MPERHLFQEFRDQYESTPYPFMDNATLQSTTGQPLDRDLFLDASLYPIGITGSLYIAAISVQSRLVRISVADQSRRERAFAEFDPRQAEDLIVFKDEWGRPAGVMVSDEVRLSRFSAWPIGEHLFDAAATTLVPSCVVPVPGVGIRGLLTDKDELFTGDVVIAGENGVVVRRVGDELATIRVDIVGDPLFLRKLCEPIELFPAPRFLRTINGCPPDEYGNFQLVVGDHWNDETVVRIRPESSGLVIEAVGDTTVTRGN